MDPDIDARLEALEREEEAAAAAHAEVVSALLPRTAMCQLSGCCLAVEALEGEKEAAAAAHAEAVSSGGFLLLGAPPAAELPGRWMGGPDGMGEGEPGPEARPPINPLDPPFHVLP